jgi:hypothetical protein
MLRPHRHRVMCGSGAFPTNADLPCAERGERRKRAAAKLVVGLTDQTLSCTAKAHVPKPTRHDTRLHVRRAMRVACRRDGFDFTRRLGRRAEAGPCQLLRRVRPPSSSGCIRTAGSPYDDVDEQQTTLPQKPANEANRFFPSHDLPRPPS